MRRFFTSDFHLGMTDILRFEKRKFKSIDDMNRSIINSCNQRATENDIIIHIGDLFSFKSDRGNPGLNINPQDYIKQIKATFINIRGNHDIRNKVKSIGYLLKTSLGKKYPHVTLCHYPSYDYRFPDKLQPGSIVLCGHVHSEWKHCLDLTNKILNINVGVDVWKYNIVSEDDLIAYIDKLQTLPLEKINCYSPKKIVYYY